MAEITPPQSQQGTPQRGPQPIPAQAPPSPTEPSAEGSTRGAVGMDLDSSANGTVSAQIAESASVPPPAGQSVEETEATAGASGAPKVAAVAATAKPKKEKKKNELFESDIVERWNTEIGDVLAPPTTAATATELSEPTPA